MAAYYNENDRFAAIWLRNLIDAGQLPQGEVDERSIEDVTAEDLIGFTQCHFFAGIAGWPLALRLAGWPDDLPVWTGSCPCQPFSSAGPQSGLDDDRHLWPAFSWLIRQSNPAVIFGEQVAAKAADQWVDIVQHDLEGMDYSFGCVAFPVAGVGGPHIRDRNYWVAHSNVKGLEGWVQRRVGADIVSPWSNGVALRGLDGQQRIVEPGTLPLANGVSGRVGQIRAYGNAVSPKAAAEFVAAFMGCI